MSIKVMTNGHATNIPYKTTLNAELRNPNEAKIIRLLAQLDQNFGNEQVKPLIDDANVTKKMLNEEFENLFPTIFPKIRYRGISTLTNEQFEFVKNLKAGDIVKDEGFAYFSKYKEVAKNFADGVNSVLIECKIPFWSKVSRMLGIIPQVQNGQVIFKIGETMLPAGSNFKVLKNNIDKNGLVKLVIKYLK